ncbi:MAG: acyltransferase [Myxococcales bacterium]|nr:acyltransferase [Myxococcales bacterium]
MSESPTRASAASSQNIAYIEGLDHLRGFAAFMVLFHHGFWVSLGMRFPPPITWNNWPKAENPLFAPLIETHVFVTVFFIVSGFIFTLVGFGKEIAYGKYMRNRVLRVMPVFLTALFFGMALFPDRFDWDRFLTTATIFGDMSEAALRLHPVTTAFWTVAVEFQFYLIFPFLIAIMNRQGPKPLLWMIALMLALRTVGFFLGDSIRDLHYWHLIPGRLDAFLIGMLGARLWLRWQRDPRVALLGPSNPISEALAAALRERPRIFFAAAIVVLLAWEWFLSQSGGYPKQAWWKIWAPTWESLVCLLGVLGYLAVAGRMWEPIKRSFAFLGDMSFSTYICHFMIVGLVIGDPLDREHMPGMMLPFDSWWPGIPPMLDATLNTLLLAFPAAILLSLLFFNGVERPFMRLRTRYVSEGAGLTGSASP